MIWRLVWVAGFVLAFAIPVAFAADHNHPPADAVLHEKFYSTWDRPDQPGVSCCSKADCYPTEARLIGGQWHAKRREDGKWLTVPSKKVERNREMPVGAHLCAPPPANESVYENGVICFGAGAGL
jgi:hypothetical protein